MTRTLFALSQHATACDNKLQIAVRNDTRLFLRTTKCYSVLKKYYSSTTLYYKVLLRTTPIYTVMFSIYLYVHGTILYELQELRAATPHNPKKVTQTVWRIICYFVEEWYIFVSCICLPLQLLENNAAQNDTNRLKSCCTKHNFFTLPLSSTKEDTPHCRTGTCKFNLLCKKSCNTILPKNFPRDSVVWPSPTNMNARPVNRTEKSKFYFLLCKTALNTIIFLELSKRPLHFTWHSVLFLTLVPKTNLYYYKELLQNKNYSSTSLYYKVLLQYYSVLQSTTPVLLCTTKYYSSTILYYKVLLQYYSVLQSTIPAPQSTTPVLLCTTKYYSSTTPVLLCTTKYYSSTTNAVLQSTTPVLLRYYSVPQSTTLYYKELFQYSSALQSTTLYYKVLLQYYSSTTLYYSVLQSTTPVLVCATKYYSSTTLYYKVLLQYYSVPQSTTPVLLSWLIRVTYETLFTMRGTTEVLLQNHRLLRLPRKMTLMIDPHHIWNVSYNARSNRDVSPTSPNTAPATKSNTHHWSSSHLKRYLQCAEQHVS